MKVTAGHKTIIFTVTYTGELHDNIGVLCIPPKNYNSHCNLQKGDSFQYLDLIIHIKVTWEWSFTSITTICCNIDNFSSNIHKITSFKWCTCSECIRTETRFSTPCFISHCCYNFCPTWPFAIQMCTQFWPCQYSWILH